MVIVLHGQENFVGLMTALCGVATSLMERYLCMQMESMGKLYQGFIAKVTLQVLCKIDVFCLCFLTLFFFQCLQLEMNLFMVTVLLHS